LRVGGLDMFIFVNTMKKRLTFIFILAAITVTGILSFQVYWVYSSYILAERNFNRDMAYALQESLDAYPLKVSKLPASLADKSPYLSLVEKIPDQPLPANIYGRNKVAHNAFRMNQLPVSSANLIAVQEMVAEILTESSQKPIDMRVLSALFKSALVKYDIVHPFKLILINESKPRSGDIVGKVKFSKHNEAVKVEIADARQYLLSQNIAPALLSLLLILLSGGSLYYMGLIIRKQVQLDGIKNDFINNVTHELRTPISILKSTHDSLLHFSDLSDVEKTKRNLNINVDILDKLDKNVDRILDITRHEQGVKVINYNVVNVDQLMNDIVSRFAAIGGQKIEYQSGLDNKLFSTDSYIIDTTVTNLVDNAIKYSGEYVHVQIITSAAGNGWQLQVRDNGIGISDQDLPYIFDKFYRVPSGNIHDVKGYGLGLSYVRLLVNNLQGTISVKSKLGSGTTFTIKFPGND
jgi:two-component system, OmpR family, phosphate regulon sensor histidine kinase PhoR